jgi:hypothetical protein
MADETATVARLKDLLARIRSGLRPGEQHAVQCDRDDIREAMLCLRYLEPGLIPAAVRLSENFRRVVGDMVGEWLAEFASGQGPECRQQLLELFGPFPESIDESDESVSMRRALLKGQVGRLAELVDDVFAAVERVYPSADANPQNESGAKSVKATVAARMMDLLMKDPATHTWTAEQFRQKLGCNSRSTITNTAAWKQLVVARESTRLQKAEQAYDKNLDKRRRPKRKQRPDRLGD